MLNWTHIQIFLDKAVLIKYMLGCTFSVELSILLWKQTKTKLEKVLKFGEL